MKKTNDHRPSAEEVVQAMYYLANIWKYESQFRCLDCSNWVGVLPGQKEVICPFCGAEYFLGFLGVDAVFQKTKKGRCEMVKVEEAKGIWKDVIASNFLNKTKAILKDMAYEQKVYDRLARIKITRNGELKKDHRETAWALKHYPSLVKLYQKRIEEIHNGREKRKSDSGKGFPTA